MKKRNAELYSTPISSLVLSHAHSVNDHLKYDCRVSIADE
jgi:hypothetical protein